MIEGIINEWLADCAELSTLELATFANTLSQDDEIVQALYLLLEERSKYSQLVETVCNQLFNFYRSRETQLQRFSLQFLPTLIYIYLNSVAHGDIKNCRTVETLLVGVYNLELVDKNGEPKAVSFRLPSLAMMSIYHEPSSLAPASLTESAVRRFEECNTKLVSWGPLKHIETLNAQNRLKVMTALLFVFNQQLGFFKKSALEQLCKVASKLVTQGFMKPGHHQRTSYGSESSFVPRLLPRIPVSSQFLLEFLHAIYFSMYNNCWYVASQAVEDVHNRACYETYPEVMLATNAIRNSSSSGPTSAQSADGSIGISVTSSNTTATILKSMITNASFRTKKLPDDLDEMLFETGETKSDHIVDGQSTSSAQRTPVHSSTRRRAWLWKNPLHNSFDDTDIAIADRHQLPGIVAPPPSTENSRRESLCSSQSSPNRSSPKRNRGEPKSKKDISQGKGKKDLSKDSTKESSGQTSDSRGSTAQRLYRVLEEQALGEAVGRLSGGSSRNKPQNQPMNLCAPGDVSPNNRYSY
ncbi:hyccin isoform X1 [Nasonia vitripennis]|uniref:Hyccin n=1 Tax=Nasonia vitripennis TaxID=7425 RepID=A0A7M7T6V1_NASVI|nr:hyccin isoform X1 [Nasonia vitripennis]XP_031778562.1 hyccin isoform X1 [Nasonia vitripennis]